METRLNGRVVVVTGASSPIGSEIARGLAREGARVVLHYHRNASTAAALGESLRCPTVGADLTDEKAVVALFDRARSEGPVEGWVHAVGVRPEGAEAAGQVSLGRWRRTLDGNLTAAFLCFRQFLLSMERAISPFAVIIGSTAGSFGEEGFLDYAAAKGALSGGFLATAKIELARVHPKGRINAVIPGWTLTPRNESVARDEARRNRVMQTMPLRRLATPADVAAAALFFCSDALSGHLTGETLTVAGGMEGRVLHPA